MGYLHIGHAGYATEIEDRTLAHLKVIILTELRADRPLSLTLPHPVREGSGRDTFWITPRTDLRFHFQGGRAPRLNRAWLRALAESVTADTGLYIMDEPADLQAVSPETGKCIRPRLRPS